MFKPVIGLPLHQSGKRWYDAAAVRFSGLLTGIADHVSSEAARRIYMPNNQARPVEARGRETNGYSRPLRIAAITRGLRRP
jgi:hypothetical protein